MKLFLPLFLIVSLLAGIASGELKSNRFAYLEENDPYYPHGDFPKLITPMWVGEDGVDAVICLTIDDMCRLFPEGESRKISSLVTLADCPFGELRPTSRIIHSSPSWEFAKR